MQTKLRSLTEQLCNTGSGFVAALLTWSYVITPFWEIKTSSTDNLSITMVFTVVSILRSYGWRRLFNWLDYKNNKKHSHDSTDINHRPRR